MSGCSQAKARQWAKQREAHLLRHGPSERSVPTFGEFAERFMDEYPSENNLKPSYVDSLRCNLEHHLLPLLKSVRLDRITIHHVRKIRALELAAGTRNKILAHLSRMLRVAVEWELIAQVPVKISRIRDDARSPEFYDFDEYEVVVEAAAKAGSHELVVVTLGGDAGLRAGEIRALRWSAVDLERKLVNVELSDWRGQETTPKSRRCRAVPMSRRLHATLTRHHQHANGDDHPRGARRGSAVLY